MKQPEHEDWTVNSQGKCATCSNELAAKSRKRGDGNDYRAVPLPVEKYRTEVRDELACFYAVNSHLFSGFVVEAGCGHSVAFKGADCQYIGIDTCMSEIAKNRYIHCGICADVSFMPIRDSSVKLIVARDMLEHLENPVQFFREAWRCLAPGGGLICQMANCYGTGMIICRLLPRKLMELIWWLLNKKHMPGYPFAYRANTEGDIHRLAKQSSLKVESLSFINSIPYWLYRKPVMATVLHRLKLYAGRVRPDLFWATMVCLLKKVG